MHAEYAFFYLGSAVFNPYISSVVYADSIRLLNGTSQCSGRLEVNSNQSNFQWSSVCQADFDQQDAEVACRELGCGAPLALQGALYGKVETSSWVKDFHCGGHELALLECGGSQLTQDNCSTGQPVGLTCSGKRGAAALVHFCPNSLLY